MADQAGQPQVLVLGLRGFPDVQGGVETHAQHLYPLLAENGFAITAAVRDRYQTWQESSWQGIRFRRYWSPASGYLEAFVHSLLVVLDAGRLRPDLVHVHAIGPSLVVPLARLLGLRVVVTHHGPDYDREKWNPVAKAVLRLGERLGMRWSHERIAVSPVIADSVSQRFDKDCEAIPNGVTLPEILPPGPAMSRFGLDAGRYVLLVSRLVPEKRHLDLIEAFRKAELPGWKLALIGAADHRSDYSDRVAKAIEGQPDIVAPGFLGGRELAEVFSQAGAFVLPSSHEGLPIALLEALSYGIPCLASDIPANLCVGMDRSRYFPLGDVDRLAELLRHEASRQWTAEDRENQRRWIAETYNWPLIAARTAEVYEKALGRKAS